MIEKANATIYGLAAAVWRRNVAKAHQTARLIQPGTVWINSYNMLCEQSPFGGCRRPGFGQELGRCGIDFCTQVRSMW